MDQRNGGACCCQCRGLSILIGQNERLPLTQLNHSTRSPEEIVSQSYSGQQVFDRACPVAVTVDRPARRDGGVESRTEPFHVHFFLPEQRSRDAAHFRQRRASTDRTSVIDILIRLARCNSQSAPSLAHSRRTRSLHRRVPGNRRPSRLPPSDG